MIDTNKPISAANQDSTKLEVSDDNMAPAETSHESHVEIKSNDEELSEESIQISVRNGFIRKVYSILSVQLIITFGAVFLFQIPLIKIIHFQKSIFSRKYFSVLFFGIFDSFLSFGL